MRIAAQDIDPPEDDVSAMNKVLWVGPDLVGPIVCLPSASTGRRADRLVEFQGPKSAEKGARSVPLDDPHRSRVMVGQYRLPTVGLEDRSEPLGDFIQGSFPGDLLEFAFPFATRSAHGMQKPIGLLLSLRIPGRFDASKAPGDRMLRISGQPDDLARIDLDVQGAGIGAIQSAHGGKDANGGWRSHGFPPLSRVHQACAIETIIGMSFSLLVKR